MKITVPVDSITRVYSGRHGCACGCRGTYSTSPATIKRIVATMNDLGAQIEDGIYFTESPTRQYTAYTD